MNGPGPAGRTAVLSAAEREQGFSAFLSHITWNGLGVFLLNNTVVSLMAIHFGASNLELGYINAAFHVTGLVSLVVPRLFRGRRIASVFGWAWMTRGFVAIFYGLLLFLSGSVARFTIILIFTGFCVARAVGVAVAHAVQREVMRDRELGGSMVRVNIRLGYAQLAAQILSFGLLSFAFLEGLPGLITIAYIGVVMNTVASAYLLRIPGRSVVEVTRGDRAIPVALRIFRNRHALYPILVHCLGMGLYVLLAFQVVFVRRVLGVPDSMAILFTLTGAVAAILANIGLKPFADNLGEKPLLIVTSGALALCALVWAMVPVTLPLVLYYVLGFVTYLFLRSLLTLKATALVKAIPERNRIVYTSTANVTLGVVALVLGLVGGALADLVLPVPGITSHQYTFTFLLAALIAVLAAVFSAKLPRGRSLSLRETADIVFSARNLRAFLDANQLDFAVDPSTRESLLLSLERSSTPLATRHLRERLRGPSVAERERVLRILFRTPRPGLVEDIISEANDRSSYTRRDAIFALGAYRDERAEVALRSILVAHESVEEVAVALKSLARHGCSDTLPLIRQYLKWGAERLPARSELDLAVAESILDPRGEQLEYLFAAAFSRHSASFAVTRLVIALNRIGLNPGVQEYLRRESNTPGRGFTELLEDASEFEIILTRRPHLQELVRDEDFGSLWRWIQEALIAAVPGADTPAPEGGDAGGSAGTAPAWPPRLARSIVAATPPAGLERSGALCALYALHHCLAASAESAGSVTG